MDDIFGRKEAFDMEEHKKSWVEQEEAYAQEDERFRNGEPTPSPKGPH